MTGSHRGVLLLVREGEHKQADPYWNQTEQDRRTAE